MAESRSKPSGVTVLRLLLASIRLPIAARSFDLSWWRYNLVFLFVRLPLAIDYGQHMKIATLIAASALAHAATAPTLAVELHDYVGPFTTQALYDLCSNPNSRDKCDLYLQGLIYGLKAQRSMQEKEWAFACQR